MYYGAFDIERKTNHTFKFLELSLFFGDYALGMYKVNDDYRFTGWTSKAKNLLNDVYAVRNGVYINQRENVSEDLCRRELLPNEYDNIDVIETFCRTANT